LLEVIDQDYVRAARAKVLSEKAVVVVHALRNAVIPISEIMGLDLGYIVGGSIVIESIFARPGIGDIILSSIGQDLRSGLLQPGNDFPLGTDEFGRDKLSRIIHGSRVSLQVGLIATVTSSLVGAQPPTPSWGSTLAGGRTYLRIAPWVTLFPGITIMITVLRFNLLGNGLRDALDRRLT
jgi:ABC-type dipeptide/oligopeptide/nickel transport system permease subunit